MSKVFSKVLFLSMFMSVSEARTDGSQIQSVRVWQDSIENQVKPMIEELRRINKAKSGLVTRLSQLTEQIGKVPSEEVERLSNKEGKILKNINEDVLVAKNEEKDSLSVELSENQTKEKAIRSELDSIVAKLLNEASYFKRGAPEYFMHWNRSDAFRLRDELLADIKQKANGDTEKETQLKIKEEIKERNALIEVEIAKYDSVYKAFGSFYKMKQSGEVLSSDQLVEMELMAPLSAYCKLLYNTADAYCRVNRNGVLL